MEGQLLVKKYTVKHKDIDRLEKMSRRPMPRLKWIKLYVPGWQYIYLPHWQFSHILEWKNIVSEKIEYSWSPTKEQASVLSEISLRGIRTWIIEMKTGRGKWHIIMQLCWMFQETALIVVHNLTTLQDMVGKFKEFTNIVPWVYSSKKKDIKEITITTHQSFRKKYAEFAGKFWLLIIDECDYNFTQDMLKAICLSDADALFWLSGTPSRKELDSDDMQLVFWSTLKVDTQDNNWYNIIPDIHRILYMTDRFFSFKDRHDLKSQMVMSKERTDMQVSFLINYITTGKTAYWLLLVDRKEQECDMYYEKLTANGINCCIINWDTKAKDDEDNIERMRNTWGIIIGTVGKVWRWKDIPFLDTVFLFFPNKFESSTIQAVGRWLRSYPWKTWCTLVDWCDLPILRAQASQRLLTYKSEYWENVNIEDTKVLDYLPQEDKVTSTFIS